MVITTYRTKNGFSVGRDSPYGHSHAEVLARWRGAGARVLTTGGRGTITVTTDGDDLKAETFVSDP
jgi:beta-lactamase superfamily II metal-dependent hydrolase